MGGNTLSKFRKKKKNKRLFLGSVYLKSNRDACRPKLFSRITDQQKYSRRIRFVFRIDFKPNFWVLKTEFPRWYNIFTPHKILLLQRSDFPWIYISTVNVKLLFPLREFSSWEEHKFHRLNTYGIAHTETNNQKRSCKEEDTNCKLISLTAFIIILFKVLFPTLSSIVEKFLWIRKTEFLLRYNIFIAQKILLQRSNFPWT